MEEEFFSVGSSEAVPEDLTYSKARDLGLRLAAGDIAHASLVECWRSDSGEIVVFDVRVEVPNQRVYDIRRRERIAATFYEGDDRLPKLEALRADFPIVPHLNLHIQEFPRSVCLDEERYEELKRSWTAPRFVRRIREWLELTSRGKLHQEDQRLEPLLVDHSGHIVLPSDLATDTPEQLYVMAIAPGPPHKWFLVADRQPPPESERAPGIITSVHTCKPRTHDVVRRCPETLADVAEIAQAAGLELISELRHKLPGWKEKSSSSKVVLILIFPKTRTDDGPVESYDTWCFLTAVSVKELGIELGIWVEIGDKLGAIVAVDEEKRGQNIEVEVLNPCSAITRKDSARLNGRPDANEIRIACVGVGALGSQVVVNMARAAFGRWTLIDDDRLMSHNVARHALDGRLVGLKKAEATAYVASTTTCEEGVFVGLNDDILRPGAKSEEIQEALSSADAIIDITASLAVQRHLTRVANSSARRVSTFLTPSGADLVILAEDDARQFPLDALEMQYYRAILNDGELAGHIEAERTNHRYARSCGDTSSAIPQDVVALHAAIASRILKDILVAGNPFIGVWRAGPTCSVRDVRVPVRNVSEFKLREWTVVLDHGLRERLCHNREKKLPNETGGVLVGSFDLEREIIYIVDTLPSPPDSEEKTDLYIRGFKGLRDAVESATSSTGGMLEYIGEWHSHPRGASTRPSEYDLAAFDWLTAHMSNDGLPAVMMIVGEAGEMSLFIGLMGKEPSPIPESDSGNCVA